MHHKFRIPFSNLTFENWPYLIILSAIVLYSVWLGFAVAKGPIQSGFAGDFLAFWSAGKVADEKGYSHIYELENLRSVQLQELNKIGILEKTDDSSFSTFPVAYLAIFVTPFQVLSKIKFVLSYWIWTFSNLIVLIVYLNYFEKKIDPYCLENIPGKKFLLLMLISYPVWKTFVEGQINIFLVICTGEFIRQAIIKKPVLSGLWLGGLLLKPQLLILIVPALLFMRSWKAISGFILSSLILLMTSFLLSGFTGMNAMVNLWTKFNAGMATNSPAAMINWRMIGIYLNSISGTSLGWVIAGLGMLLTIVLVCILIKCVPSFGSSAWVITMAAVFSATLAVTWHSHYHMAVVLIPFLIYASQFKLLQQKVIFSWAMVTPVLVVLMQLIALLFFLITNDSFIGIGYLISISGFCLNLLILFSTMRYLNSKQKFPKIPFISNPTV